MFDNEDLKKYRAFKYMVSKAKFELSGDALLKAADLHKWFEELEKKLVLLKEAIEKEKSK